MYFKQNLLEILKGVVISVIVSLVGVLIFAYLIKVFSLSSSVIKPVNQVIKVVAVMLGGLLSIRAPKGLIKGGIVGLMSVESQYLIFGIISKNLSFGVGQMLDLIFGLIMGIIVGVICSFFKKSTGMSPKEYSRVIHAYDSRE